MDMQAAMKRSEREALRCIMEFATLDRVLGIGLKSNRNFKLNIITVFIDLPGTERYSSIKCEILIRFGTASRLPWRW